LWLARTGNRKKKRCGTLSLKEREHYFGPGMFRERLQGSPREKCKEKDQKEFYYRNKLKFPIHMGLVVERGENVRDKRKDVYRKEGRRKVGELAF